jgi:hypothetical protein
MGKPRLFSGKSLLVYIVVGYLFYYLYSYRLNDPLPVSSKIPETELYTLNGERFYLNDYRNYKFLIFFDKNSIYAPYYLKVIPDIKLISDALNIDIFVLLKKPTDSESVKEIILRQKYKSLENITFLANIKVVSRLYGVRSWPHLYLVDAENRIVYQAKLPSVSKIDEVLRRF